MLYRNSVFVSYSRADERSLQRLQVHLAPLVADGRVDVWDDTRIAPGDLWQREIEDALMRARAAVLLVSADFLASEFIQRLELPQLLAAARARGTVILPVILSPCRYVQIPDLAQFQSVNSPSRPLSSRSSRSAQEKVWHAVSLAVEAAFPEAERRAETQSVGEGTENSAADKTDHPEESQVNVHLLGPLGVFASHFTADAAEYVCGTGPNTADDLEAARRQNRFIVDWSSGHPRYKSIGEPGAGEQESPENPAVRQRLYERHAQFYCALVERAERRLESAQQEPAQDEVRAEYSEVKAVLERARTGVIDLEVGVRIAGALGPYWYLDSSFNKGRRTLEGLRKLAGFAAVAPAVQAKALLLEGIFCYHQTDYNRARSLIEQAKRLFQSLRENDEASKLLPELNLTSPEEGVAKALNCLGYIAKEEGEYEAAVGNYVESLQLYNGVGKPWGIAWTEADYALALLCRQLGAHPEEALTHLASSLERNADDANQPSTEVLAILYTAYGMLAQGRDEAATELAEQSLARARQLRFGRGTALAAHFKSLLLLTEDEYGKALALLRESLSICRAQEDRAGVADCLEALAVVYSVSDNLSLAVKLLGHADITWSRLGGRRGHPEYSQLMARLEGRLAELRLPANGVHWADGRRTRLSNLVDELNHATYRRVV